MAEIAAIRKLDDAEALQWLRSQPGGRINLPAAELGQRFGWTPQRTGRRLASWTRARLIKKHGDTITNIPAGEMPEKGISKGKLHRPREKNQPIENASNLDKPLSRSKDQAKAELDARINDAQLGDFSRINSLGFVAFLAYGISVILAGAAAYFSIRGFVVLFPGAPTAIVVLGSSMEGAKLVAVAFLGRQWRLMGRLSRAVLVTLVTGLAAINATGVASQLIAAHFGDRVNATGTVQTEVATVSARIEAQTHALADVDSRISQIDAAIAEMTRRGRTSGAFEAMQAQRKTREALLADRRREAEVLTNLKSAQAAAAAKAHAVEIEAAPIAYVAQLVGATTDQAIRWLIGLIVLCADPTAIALTAAAAAATRRS